MTAYCVLFARSRFIALLRTVFVLVGLVQIAVVLMQYTAEQHPMKAYVTSTRTSQYTATRRLDHNEIPADYLYQIKLFALDHDGIA